MKKFLSIVAIAISLVSCLKDEDIDKPVICPIMREVAVQSNENHRITIFSNDGKLYQGYNNITVSITDIKTNENVKVDKVTFNPEMTMKMKKMNFKHSCPHSKQFKKEGDLFKGYALFQMKTNKMGFWELNFTYTIAGKEYKVEKIKVEVKEKKGLYSTFKKFKGTDKKSYYLSLVEHNPKIGLNEDVKLMLVKVEGTGKVENGIKDLQFTTPKDYMIKLDPRMAGEEMGNHSSEGNKNPKYDAQDDLFHMTVGYSMGGNWTLNFMIEDKNGKLIAGSKVDCDLSKDGQDCDVNSKSTVALEVDVPN